MTYMFGAPLPDEVIAQHNRCGGAKSCGITPHPWKYSVTGIQRSDGKTGARILENFMGYRDRRVKFLGHGVGLLIDEIPVIAEGFDEPLEENMVFALEPKKGITGVGMVGIENTFVVTKDKGSCITGTNPGLSLV